MYVCFALAVMNAAQLVHNIVVMQIRNKDLLLRVIVMDLFESSLSSFIPPPLVIPARERNSTATRTRGV